MMEEFIIKFGIILELLYIYRIFDIKGLLARNQLKEND